MKLKIMVVVGFLLFGNVVIAKAFDCDQKVLRSYNHAADIAFEHKGENDQAYARFHAMMHKILQLNLQGCYLPASDPDSVLFRSPPTRT